MADRFRFGLQQLLFVFAVIAIVFTVVGMAIRVTVANRIAQAEMSNGPELAALDHALEGYQLWYGERPPPPDTLEIIEHVHRRYAPAQRSRARFEPDTHDFSELDASESLVFWLGGGAQEQFLKRPSPPLFDFDVGRLVDCDSDGWKEYVDRDGNVFTYSNGDVFVHCPATGRQISLKYLSRQYGR